MDFGLIALIMFVGSKVLDYIAPRTKTKVDDAFRDAIHKVLPLLPAAKAAAAARPSATTTVQGARPAPEAKLSGFNIRDHRGN